MSDKEPMRLVVLESPFAGNVEKNIEYAQRCMRDCLMRGDAPFASHLLYTQPNVLDDDDPGERSLGFRAGFYWGARADACVVYTDKGLTSGMVRGIKKALKKGVPVEYRSLEHGQVISIESEEDILTGYDEGTA